MTASELIKILESLDDDMIVMITKQGMEGYNDEWFDLERLEINFETGFIILGTD